MFRKILNSLLVVLLLAYLVLAVAFVNPKAGGDKACTDLQIEVVASGGIAYLNSEQVNAYLRNANMQPVGKKMAEINTAILEKTLETNRLIKEAVAYKTIDGTVRIKVYQRVPVLRVISEKGNYYVDSERQIMPIPNYFAAHVPLATGNISDEYAKNQLFDFAQYLRKHKSWNEDIEQIHILSNLDVELIPQKGNHSILLGKMEDYEENLDKLALFYKKGLDKVGWNKYSVINLKYKNQVVCTKRK